MATGAEEYLEGVNPRISISKNPFVEDEVIAPQDGGKIMSNPFTQGLRVESGDNFQPSQNYSPQYYGLEGSKYDEGFLPNLQGMGDLERHRATNQPWHHEVANMLTQFAGTVIGDTLSSTGYLLDLTRGHKAAMGAENFLVSLGESISEGARELAPIYRSNPDGFMLTDREAFLEQMVSVGSTIALMLPSIGVSRLLGGLGKLVKLTQRAEKVLASAEYGAAMKKVAAGILNPRTQMFAAGISQATVSRHMESMMEMSEVYNRAIEEGFSHEEALQAADTTYKANWWMLMQDIPQYLAIGKIFDPALGKFVKAGSSKAAGGLPKMLTGAKGYATALVSEGFEEGYQYAAAEEAMAAIDGLYGDTTFDERMGGYLRSTDFWNSVVSGGIGGAVFQGVGPALNKLGTKFSKEKRETLAALENAQKDYIQNRGISWSKLYAQIEEAKGDPDKMRIAYKAWNAAKVVEAIGLKTESFDSVGSHKEYLQEMANMDEKKAKELSEQYGVEFDPKQSKELAETLLKDTETLINNFNKFGQTYNAQTASRLAVNRLYLEHYEELKQDATQKSEEARKNFPNHDQLTPHGREYFDLALEEFSLRKSIAVAKEGVKIEKYRDVYTAQLNRLEAKLKAVRERRKALKNEDTRSEDEVTSDAAIISSLDKDKDKGDMHNKRWDPIVNEEARKRLATEHITQLEEQYKYLISDKGQREQINQENLNKVKATASEQQLDLLEKELRDNGQITGAQEAIDKKREEFKAKREGQYERIANHLIETEGSPEGLSEEDKEFLFANRDAIMDKMTNIVLRRAEEEADAADDDTFDEGGDGDGDYAPQTNLPKTFSTLSSFLRVAFREKNGSTDGFHDWMMSGEANKMGHKVKLELSTDFQKENKDADTAEIKATVLDENGNTLMFEGKPVFTYLYLKDLNPFEIQFRRSIYKALKAGKEVLSEISYISPMDLATDFNEDGTVAENHIEDALGADVELLVVDKKGRLIPVDDRKTISPLSRSNPVEGENAGLFMAVINNSQGRPIPVKLNRMKINEEQADFVADLFRAVTSTTKEEEENNMLNVAVSDEVLQKFAKILGVTLEDALSLANAVNGSTELTTPTYGDLIQFFVYRGKTLAHDQSLILSKGYVKYRQGGKTISIHGNELMTEDGKKQLIDFLMTKRFNVRARGLANEAYKKFVFDNKYLNTDLPTEGSKFQKEFDNYYRGEMYISGIPVIDGKVPKNSEVASKVNTLLSNKAMMRGLTEDGELVDLDGEREYAQYARINEQGEIVKVYDRTTSAITDSEEEYNREEGSLLWSSNIIGTKIDNLIRDFFDGNLKELSSYGIGEQEMVEDFLLQLDALKQYFKKTGETVIAKDIVLFSDELGIAGTPDIVTYDKNGVFRIYDIKTMRQDQFNQVIGMLTDEVKGTTEEANRYDARVRYDKDLGYIKDNKQDSPREKHQNQLSVYAILAAEQGIDFKEAGIFPIKVDYEKGETSTHELSFLQPDPDSYYVKHELLPDVKGIKKAAVATEATPEAKAGGEAFKVDGANYIVYPDGTITPYAENAEPINDPILANKIAVKKARQDGTLETHPTKPVVKLPDGRLISTSKSSAGKEVYTSGAARKGVLAGFNTESPVNTEKPAKESPSKVNKPKVKEEPKEDQEPTMEGGSFFGISNFTAVVPDAEEAAGHYDLEGVEEDYTIADSEETSDEIDEENIFGDPFENLSNEELRARLEEDTPDTNPELDSDKGSINDTENC